jgi:Ca-activated chloride channel family protein
MNEPNRLPLLKESLKLLVNDLTPRDRVALVAYAGSAGLVLPSTRGDDKAAILNALGQMEAGGSTNGGEGIVLAYKEARKNFIKDGLNRVILGTDGDFNVGVTSEGDLLRLIDEERKSGVCLTVLGYGMGNLKDATMEKLAHHGHGHYAYIDGMREARKVFVEQGAALVTVAKDVKLQIEFNPARVGAYRLIGYENRLMRAQDFNDDSKHAGDVGSGHTVTALYEVIPAGQPLPVPGVDALKYQQPPKPAEAKDEWLTVKLRYKDPTADTSKLLSQALSGPVGKFDKQPADFRFAAAVASFGMLLRNSEHRGGASYAGVRELAKDALGDDPHGHRAEFLKLVDAAAGLAPRR